MPFVRRRCGTVVYGLLRSDSKPGAGRAWPQASQRLAPTRRRSTVRVGAWRCHARAPILVASSAQHGLRRRLDSQHLNLLAVDQIADARAEVVLPIVALVHRLVEPLALLLAVEAPDPEV